MARSKANKQTINASSRQVEALRLRASGMNYEEIGREMGIPKGSAYRHVMKALAALRENVKEEADQVRVLELQRLDRLFKRAFEAVDSGDIRAIDQAIKCMDRRAKLLGLDMPAKLAQTDSQGRDIEGWQHLQAVVLQVLEPHPEIKEVLIDRLLREEK